MPYHSSQALLSSPDPLNDSLTFSSPVKPHTPRIRSSFPLEGSSPRKQTFQLHVGDRLSPQKIRVTVEAEHARDSINNERRASDGQNLPSSSPYRAPAIRQSVRTTTTTVPVKGLSDSDDESFDSASERPTRGRGRPRKSIGTPVPAKSRNRAVTPAAKPSPRRRRTLGHLIDGDDTEDWDFAIGAGVEVSRGKGRSRSRSVRGVTRNRSTPAAKQIPSPDKQLSSTASRKGRGRRKTLTPEEIVIHEDEINLTPNFDTGGDERGSDTKGILALQDTNMVPTRSASGTDRLNTAIRNDDPDVLHDKFSPAKRAVAKGRRLTPKAGSTQMKSSASSHVDIPLESTRLPVMSAFQPIVSGGEESFDGHENDQVRESDVDEIREFDTILESEGFSMISVDSVPSLREHLSSPLGLNQNSPDGEPAVTKREFLCTENDNDAYNEDSFSNIAPEILEAATPRKRASNPLLRAAFLANIPGDGDSFSSIPPEILEAATPGKLMTDNNFLSVRAQDRKFNDDSFSSIPHAILEAATPAKQVQTKATESNAISEPNKDPKRVSKLATISSLQSLEAGKRSLTSSGLLTPNETPSPTEMAAYQTMGSDLDEQKPLGEAGPCNVLLPEESSIANSQLRSSPPVAVPRRFTRVAHSLQPKPLHGNHLETPSMVFSSPSLPPLLPQSPLDGPEGLTKLNDINRPPRQPLSPIVRAGRVLQDIAMKSTSRSCTQSLGSPFKSPAAPRNSLGTPVDYFVTGEEVENPQWLLEKIKGKDGDLFVGFSDDTRRELRKSMIMGEELAHSQKCDAGLNPTRSVQEADPFHVGNKPSCLPTTEEGREYSLQLPSHGSRLQIGLEKGKQRCQASPCNDSDMSWQAESTVPMPVPYTGAGQTGNGTIQSSQQRREAEWARKRAAVSLQIESASPSKVILIESDGDEGSVCLGGEVDDAEEDIWQAEARHSSSIIEEQSAKVLSRQEPSEKPRRSKIPSPWRKKSKGLVYSDELSQFSSPGVPENIDNLPSNEHIKPNSKPAQITVRKRVLTHDIADDEDLPESSIMWHIPQKSNFVPRPRSSGNLDLSALLASSPFKRPQPASQPDWTPQDPTSAISRGKFSKSADDEPDVSRLTTALDIGPEDSNGESQPVENSLQHENSGESANTSHEESEVFSEPSYTDSGALYPNLPNTISLSPQKSCLRTPMSTSPTKSVAFVSPTPSPLPLSDTTWSKAHWKLLHAIYDESKSHMDSKNGNPDQKSNPRAVEPPKSKYLGKTIQARGAKLTLEQRHLDIVQEFREEVPGWDEGVIAKRLFAIIAGEDLRRQGKQ